MAAVASKTYSLKTVLSCQDQLSEKLKTVRKNLKTLDRAFAKTTKAAGEAASKLLAPITAVAGAGLFSVKNAVDTFMALGDSVDKAAIRAGVATGALQRLRAAAKLSGMSAEQMDKALTKLSYQMGLAASGGNDKLVTLFKDLGVQWKDGKGRARDAATVMRELADAVKVNEDPAVRLQMLTQIFGDDLAAYLIPALQGGAEGLDKMAAQADALGIVMAEKDVKAAAALGDAFSIFKDVVSSLSAAIGANLAPILMRIIEQVQKAIIANKDLIALRMKEWVEQFAQAIERVNFTDLINGTFRLIDAVSSAFNAIGGMKTVVVAASAIFAGQALVSVVNLTKALWGFGAALYGTVGLPVAVAAACAAAAVAVYAYWDEIWDFLKSGFEKVGSFFSEVWDGIVGKFKSFWEAMPEWLKKFFAGDGGKLSVAATNTERLVTEPPLAAPPPAEMRYGAPGAPANGTVTIRVMTDKDSKAAVEGVMAESGEVDVENIGAYDYLDTF